MNWQELWAWRFAPLNAVSYGLRRRLRGRIRKLMLRTRGLHLPRNESKNDLFSHLPAEQQPIAEAWAAELQERFDLGGLAGHSSKEVWLENLALLDVLQRVGKCLRLPVGEGPLRALDIGSRNWSYCTAQERFLRSLGSRPVELTGVEVDGYHMAKDGRPRIEHARAHARLTGNPAVRYVVRDVLDHHDQRVDVVFLLFPFLSHYALLHWGLPPTLLRPQELIDHCLGMLRPGGHLVTMHQTPWEAERAREHVGRWHGETGGALASEVGTASGEVDQVPWCQATARRSISIWRVVESLCHPAPQGGVGSGTAGTRGSGRRSGPCSPAAP